MPKQVTVEIDVPDGYEATGELRRRRITTGGPVFTDTDGALYIGWSSDFILRRVKPKTVMVEMPRQLAEDWRITTLKGSSLIPRTKEACRAALEKEAFGETVQPNS